MRQIFLDTETTGLSPDNGDRILDLGCIEMVNRRLTGRRLHHYINPQRKSHEDALRIHGLTEQFLADKPLFADIAAEFLAFVQGAEVIIHNAAFDVGFIDAELKRLGLPRLAGHVAGIKDSLAMAREMFPGKANSLDALCKRLEVDNTHRDLHGAVVDASLLAEVYIRMTRGQNSLVVESEDDRRERRPEEIDLAVDLSQLSFITWPADVEELARHDIALADLDKASGGKTLWRTLDPVAIA
jgi:DNA polymerase III subunit epsilon